MGMVSIAHNKPWLGTQVNWGHPLARSLVGCWLMNEGSSNKVNDLSGNGYTGIGIATVLSSGKFGSAMSFNGIAQTKISLGSPSRLNLNANGRITISAWVYRRTTGVSGGIFKRGMDTSSSGVNQMYLLYLTSGNIVSFVIGNGATSINSDSSVAIPLNTWTLITARISEANYLEVFINGVQSGTPVLFSLTPDNYNSKYIGTHKTTTASFDGLISSVFVWDRALTASEVLELYRNPFGMFERKSIELWTPAFAGGTPKIIYDYGIAVG